MNSKIASEIFKGYDIRGIYPSTINKKTAYLIGRAFVKFLKKPKANIVVGRDNRLSSPILFKNIVQGITDEGGNVYNIGLSPTPLFYFAVAHFNFDGGINITASHNPPQYNGFKLVREKALPISENTGIEEIKKLVVSGRFKRKKKGKIRKKSVIKEYIKFNLKEFNLNFFKPFKIVIDSANSVSGILIDDFFKNTPHKIFHLFKRLDGSFPNHNPDPLIKSNLRFIKKEVKEKRADLGIAFDGDGDRIVFLDEKGRVIYGDLILALISKYILKENPGQKILYDVRCSNIVKETILDFGGIPVLSRVGHSFIKEKMKRENIFFGGEFSSHFYYSLHYFCEAPFFVLFKILEILSKEKKPFSKVISPFKKYFHSEEINFKIKNKEETIIKKIRKKYKKGKETSLDGLRIDFKDWWFSIRFSQTEPLLRLIVEAKSKKLMEQKKKELISIIK